MLFTATARADSPSSGAASGTEDGMGASCPTCNGSASFNPFRDLLSTFQQLLSAGQGGSVGYQTSAPSQGGTYIENRVDVETEKEDCGFTTLKVRTSTARAYSTGELEKEFRGEKFGAQITAKLGLASTMEMTLPDSTWNQ
ncbi:MAG: hypothetical protein ACREFI_14305, partial [Stellaceae bacterium]